MNKFAGTLKEIIDHAFVKLRRQKESSWLYKEDLDKWSNQEILGHLIDSAHHNMIRFSDAPLKDDLIFQGYDQDKWVEINRYQSREIGELIDLWYQSNAEISEVISAIPDEVLFNNSNDHNFHLIAMKRVEEGASCNLAYLVWDYIHHLEHHLGQILKGYQPHLPDYQSFLN